MHVSHPAQLLCTELLYKSRESKKCRLSVVRSGCSHGRCRRCRTEFCAEQLPAASSTTCWTARCMFNTFPLAKFLADSDSVQLFLLIKYMFLLILSTFIFLLSTYDPCLISQFSSCYSNWMKFIPGTTPFTVYSCYTSFTLVIDLNKLLLAIIAYKICMESFASRLP